MKKFIPIVASLLLVGSLAACSADSTSSTQSGSVPSSAAPVSKAPAKAKKPVSTPPALVYKVTGSGKADITYMTDSGTEQLSAVSLPWTKTIKKDTSLYSVVAQQKGTGKVSCTILHNGKKIKHSTSNGAYVLVTCAGTALD